MVSYLPREAPYKKNVGVSIGWLGWVLSWALGASPMFYKTPSLKSISILSIQGKRALKKDAAKRKPSEVKSQIEVLTTASLLH